MLPLFSAAGQRPTTQRDTVSVPTLIVLLFANDGPTATAAANSLIAHAETDTTILPTLVRALGDDDVDQRVARTILEIDPTGAKVLPLLLAITDEPTERERYLNAMWLIGDYGPNAWTAATPLLDRVIHSPRRWNGLEMETLFRIGVDSVSPPLRKAAIDSFRVRANRGVEGATEMLSLLGAPAADALIEVGTKGNTATTIDVIQALALLADSRDSVAVRYLISQLDASSGAIREEAALVLQATGEAGLPRLDSVRLHGSTRASKAAAIAIAGINLGLKSGLVGTCYRLETGDWTSEGKVGWSHWGNPRVVRFTLMPGHAAFRGVQWRLVPTNGSREMQFHTGAWSLSEKSPTKVTLSWYDGLSGPILTLDAPGDSLSGAAVAMTDVAGHEPYRAKAWAVRVPCTAH
jgi:hypothetical protein